MDAPWRIELFGGLCATRGTQDEVRRFRRQKVGALLAYLAYYSHRAHPRDLLIELLWPECDLEVGRNRLSVSLSSLRRQFEPPGVPAGAVIVADHSGVRLNPTAVTTDVARFEAALQAAARADSSVQQMERLTDAVELYRGELLPGYFEEWVLPERERQAEAFFQAVGQLIALLEKLGERPRAIQWGRRAVAADPLREEAHRDLIRLLAAAGQQEAALRQYRELERLLDEQLGEEPSPETQALLASLRLAARGSQLAAKEGDSSDAKPGAREAEGTVRRGGGSVPAASREPRAASAPQAPPTGTVTFLFTDVEGSTALWERAGDDYTAALADHHAVLRRLFEEHGGHEVNEMGDGFLVVFQRAGDALACAMAGQRALASHSWPDAVDALRVRMGLHTGDVQLQEEGYRGLAIHYAQRVLAAGHGGQILCSEVTTHLLRQELTPEIRLVDRGVYRLRGIATPERLFQVEYPEIVGQTFPPLRAEAGYASQLPIQFTRFFGREEEIDLLGKLLLSPDTRLVTLMGPGGTGKTRLSLEVAGQLVEEWHGAVWFVPLEGLAEAKQLAEAIRDAMRLPRSPGEDPMEQVIAALARQPSLLLLDNFEQLVRDGAPQVQTLLERASGLTCLVTSRQRLELAGERAFLVPPLPLPTSDQRPPTADPSFPRSAISGRRSSPAPEGLSAEESDPGAWVTSVAQNACIRLFVDRAQGVRPDFQVTGANAAVLAELCARLEGIPLALELAAARVGVLTPAQILQRLSQRFDLLARRGRESNSRHSSLRAAIDWSYHLLSPELQRFFRSLSVFRGGFTLEAAEVAIENSWALDDLAELRECSLVLAEEPLSQSAIHEMRYRLLETLREYGAEQSPPDERTALAGRHATFYLDLAEKAEAEMGGAAQSEWLDRLEQERDNLRAALTRLSESGDWEPGLRLAGALQRFWAVRGYLREGRERLGQLLALPGAEAASQARAKALNGAGILARLQSDYGTARASFEEALAIRRALGDRLGSARLLNNVGLVALEQGDPETAQAYFAESLAILRELDDPRGIANALNSLGIIAHDRSDYHAARALFEESLAIKRELGDSEPMANTLMNLANVTLNLGDYEGARALHEEGLAIRRELGDRWGTAFSLQNLGNVALDQGDHETARTLYEESLAIRRELGDQRGIADCLVNLGCVARRQNDDDTARSLFDEGLGIYRKIGNQRGIGPTLCELGAVTLRQGDAGAARALLVESLNLQLEQGEQRGIAECLEGLASVSGSLGQFVRAARLLGAAEGLREAIRAPRPPGELGAYEQIVTAARSGPGAETFAEAWAEGQRMTLEQAVACAKEEADPL